MLTTKAVPIELKQLDFRPTVPCTNPACSADAKHAIACLHGASGYLPICAGCLDELLALCAESLTIACSHCGETAARFDELAELMTL